MSLRLPMGLEEIPEPLVSEASPSQSPLPHCSLSHSNNAFLMHVMGNQRQTDVTHSPTALPRSVYPKPSIITDPGRGRYRAGFPAAWLAPPTRKGHCEGLVLEWGVRQNAPPTMKGSREQFWSQQNYCAGHCKIISRRDLEEGGWSIYFGCVKKDTKALWNFHF